MRSPHPGNWKIIEELSATIFLHHDHENNMEKLMSKLWIIFCILSLMGCTAQTTQPTAIPLSRPTEIPTLPAAIVPTPTIAADTPAPTLIPTAPLTQIFITASSEAGDANVRSGPATSFASIGSLKAGEKARVLGQSPNNEWLLIEFPAAPQGKAWVYVGIVNMSGGTPPIVDPDTGTVLLPSPTAPGSQMGRPAALEAIKQYLRQDAVEIDYLGENINLNYPDQKVGNYQVGMTEFSVELQTDYIVVIDDRSNARPTGAAKKYTPQQLEQMARTLIASLVPHVNLALLSLQPGNKGSNYFFRWEDTSKPGWVGHPFIQVAYNIEGKMLNYFNALGIE
jgi:hypothetical protein